MANVERDEHTGTDTTGHEWDGIKELNTPLPKWWLYTFYATIIWSIGYMVAYPAWPLIESNTQGVLGYSSRAAVHEELAQVDAERAGTLRRLAEADLEEIATDPELLTFARAGGASAFRVNCSQCHGSGAAGGGGYPNLNDDEWLWGGSLDEIYVSVAHGIRYDGDPDTRFSEMPAFQRDGLLTSREVATVADYVLALNDKVELEAETFAQGAQLFADNCATCHADNAGGMRDLGAPSLTDAIWLYGSERQDLIQTIGQARNGVMPGWEGKLDEATLKKLSVYVHSLGGGE